MTTRQRSLSRKCALAALFVVACPQRTAAQQAPELVVQRADDSPFWVSAARAPLYASGGGKTPVTFWDARTGTLLRRVTLAPPDPNWAYNDAPPVRISDDGRFAVASISNTALILIETQTGRETPLRLTLSGTVRPLTISPDGRVLACDVIASDPPSSTGTGAETIALVSTTTGRVERTLPGAGSAAFSPDGRFVAVTTSRRDRIITIDLRSGHIRAFGGTSGVYGPIAYSADGKLIGTAADEPSIPPRGDGSFDPSSTAHDLFVSLWDARRARLIERFPFRRTWRGNPLNEQAQGAFAFTSANSIAIGGDSSTRLYDIRTRKVLTQTNGNPYAVDRGVGFVSEPYREVVFTRWTGSRAVEIAGVAKGGPQITSLRIDGFGRTFAISNAPGSGTGAAWWNLNDLTQHRTIVNPVLDLTASMDFLADGRLAFYSGAGVAYVDPSTGAVQSYRVPSIASPTASRISAAQFVAPSADGRIIFSGLAITQTLGAAFDIATGRRRYALDPNESVPVACSAQRDLCAFVVTPSEALPSGGLASLSLRDVKTGNVLHTLALAARASGAFIDDGTKFALRGAPVTSNVDGTDSIDIIDTAGGAVERTFTTQQGELVGAARAGRIAILGERATVVYDTAGHTIATLDEAIGSGANGQMAMWPDGSKIAFAHNDGSIVIRNVAGGRIDLTFAIFTHRGAFEWLAYTPAGYYVGSSSATHAIRWRLRDAVFPASRFAQHYARSDLVAAALH